LFRVFVWPFILFGLCWVFNRPLAEALLANRQQSYEREYIKLRLITREIVHEEFALLIGGPPTEKFSDRFIERS